jgi:transcription antitermination factor NusA-like protein
MPEIIKWLLIASGITLSPTFVILVFLFLHPDKFEHWGAIFWRIIYFSTRGISKIRQKVDRHVVASSIQDSVNGVCEQINKESPDVLPHALKIEWVHSESPESFIKNGQAVVRLKHYANQDRNIVDSTLLYLKTGLLPRSKNYLDSTLRQSCEFKVATKVFMARRDTGAYDYFLENNLIPTINTNLSIKEDIQMLEDLDSKGFFTRVFLAEIKQTGEKLLGTIPTSAIQQELRNFAVFLRKIANKKRGEREPLDFKGVKVKAAMVLLADREVIQLYAIKPYINRVKISSYEGYDSIYISGWGEEFIKKVIDVKKEIAGKFVTVLRTYVNYPIKDQLKGILLVCQSNLSYLARRRELQEEVAQAMNEIVPEIKNGDVQIVSIARIKDGGCKIAVRPASGGDVSDAMRACIGENGERAEALRARLPNEFVAIIPWSDTIQEYILNALFPLKRRDVNSVEIDEEQLFANVKVISEEAYKKALGKGHFNIKLANELTGWVINIEGPKERRAMPAPDEELRELINRHIPEINNNEIEVLRIARIKGIGSKVAVRWKDKDKHKERMASQVCRKYCRPIQQDQDIIGEWLYFCEYNDDPKQILVESLYPLDKTDVESIDLNYEDNVATITLTNKQKSSPVWRGQYNIVLAEKVTGWKIEIKERH